MGQCYGQLSLEERVEIYRLHSGRRLVQRLNNTPRKCLDFKTPAEAFSKLKSTVALQT